MDFACSPLIAYERRKRYKSLWLTVYVVCVCCTPAASKWNSQIKPNEEWAQNVHTAHNDWLLFPFGLLTMNLWTRVTAYPFSFVFVSNEKRKISYFSNHRIHLVEPFWSIKQKLRETFHSFSRSQPRTHVVNPTVTWNAFDCNANTRKMMTSIWKFMSEKKPDFVDGEFQKIVQSSLHTHTQHDGYPFHV